MDQDTQNGTHERRMEVVGDYLQVEFTNTRILSVMDLSLVLHDVRSCKYLSSEANKGICESR